MNAACTYLVIHPDDVAFLLEQGFICEQRPDEWGFFYFELAAEAALRERGSRGAVRRRKVTP